MKKHPFASLTGTVDLNGSAAQWSVKSLGTPCFGCLSQALDNVSADSVLVVTNPSQHKPVTPEALHCSKHVLVEKPMVTSIDEANEIAVAAEHSSGKVMAAQGYRFLQAAKFLRGRIAAGDIGDLKAVIEDMCLAFAKIRAAP